MCVIEEEGGREGRDRNREGIRGSKLGLIYYKMNRFICRPAAAAMSPWKQSEDGLRSPWPH